MDVLSSFPSTSGHDENHMHTHPAESKTNSRLLLPPISVAKALQLFAFATTFLRLCARLDYATPLQAFETVPCQCAAGLQPAQAALELLTELHL